MHHAHHLMAELLRLGVGAEHLAVSVPQMPHIDSRTMISPGPGRGTAVSDRVTTSWVWQ